MKSFKFTCLVVASNIASVIVTTVAIIFAWHGTKTFSTKVALSSHHRIAQECCSCPAPLVDSTTFRCPAEEGSVNFTNEGAIEFFTSNSNRLCTLVQISPNGQSLKPVGRSYAGYDWEASSGEFATLDWSCNGGSSCVANLPPLPTGALYQLTSFDAPELVRNEIDEVARFLEQATFGPTRADIGNFDVANLPQAFANWVQEQQVKIPITSHRAMFRRHLNARMDVATNQGAITHPCQKGTRYRRFAFSSKDYYKFVDITTVGTKRIISIDGFVRTVVEGPVVSFWDPSVVWPDGSYQILGVGNFNILNGPFYMYHPIIDILLPTFNGEYGNPGIDFDSSINANPNVLINLSSSNAIPIDEKYFENEDVTVQELILTQDLSDTICDSLGVSGNPINPVFALYDGIYWIHDPRFETISNTVESPAPDGGGKVARETFNSVQPDLAGMCSNAPRTFLNEDSCAFSDAVTACAAGSYDSDGGYYGYDFYVVMNPQTMRNIYKLTGDGAEGTRYLYAIEGLRVEEDRDISFPCDRNAISRWIPITCTGAHASLDPTMHEIFSLLLFYSDDEENEFVRDIWNWWDEDCPAPLFELVGFEVQDDTGTCWKNVHPDHLSVYDFTYWTQSEAHPGNSEFRNPIKEFAEAGKTTLTFPDWHGMDRWAGNKEQFEYAGRIGDVVHYYDLPSELRSPELNEHFGFTSSEIEYTDSTGVLVCGSPFEEANDPNLFGSQRRGAFDSLNWYFTSSTDLEDFMKQKRIIWTEAALTANDQLRQRVAWALAQILVVSPDAVQDGIFDTESMITYYDIFVRNAFGNYRDVLKEVSYSAPMADMLTYYGSQSTAYIWQVSGNLEYADENYAREIMQLFTTGLFKLNPDGSQIIGDNGDPLRVYTNEDIVEYARVWTGFESRARRGNIEQLISNRIDPMEINMAHRDIFPKMGLDRKYIGDGVPLCADLPEKHFLMAGATYRLLGTTPTPELLTDANEWASDPLAVRLKLQTNGANCLFAKLCGSQNPSNCKLEAKVVLDESVGCSGTECSVDTVRVVEVSNGIFYEYVRAPCVYQAFFDNPKMIIRRWDWWDLTCADPRTQVASSACCSYLEETDELDEEWNDMYWGERTTFATAEQRCDQNLCNLWNRPSCDGTDLGTYCSNNEHFWTNTACTLRAKIDSDGTVAIVHAPENIEPEAISRHVQNETKTFFRVDWSGDYNSIISDCEAFGACSLTVDGFCVCDMYVTDEQVFFDGDTPRREEVLNSLHIGAFDPKLRDSSFTSSSNGGVTTYTENGGLTSESVFEVMDANGIRQLRKNVKSTVHLTGVDISFRTPVHFISLSDAELHEAHAETDAALDHYFYHPNTAPFLAIRFAQRFGISNPSPGYIDRIAIAFRTGSYSFTDGGSPVMYGSGDYGDIGAMVACVLLDREARTALLDADPAHGSMKEPLIKIVGLMRALEFVSPDGAGFVDFDIDINRRIGQMAHAIPNVFSFFLPEYKPAGPVAQASLVAPEAQIIAGSRTIDLLNGLLSLIKYGLSPCFGGFAPDRWYDDVDCDNITAGADNDGSLGKLAYSPSDSSSSDTITDELATLLTSGRLSLASRELIGKVIQAEPNPALALIKAQQLITFTPEFHSTNVARMTGETRPEPEAPPPSTKPYKAVVYLLLDGGMDSFNMLAPHTCSATNSDGKTLLQQYYSERTSIAITEDERSRVIDATGQPCDQFVIHQDLEIVERLYKDGDLAFFANAGVINRPVNKNNYWEQTKTELFAHNTMQEEAQKTDPFDDAPGTGILGRMCDTLKGKGFTAQPITVEDATIATVGVPGTAIDPLFVSPYGANEFNPTPEGETFDPRPYLDQLNDATELQSSLFGETWSKRLQTALSDNEALVEALSSTQLKNEFAETRHALKLKAVATLITSHSQRGTDRDVFYASLDGWDNHQGLKADLASNFQDLNGALTSFYNEMKAQGYWDNVTLVITSDFARTLTANSGEGSDHAWGGNYFVMGGAVKGGQIHGDYPGDITTAGPYNIGRGRLIPTMSWESILHPIVQWMGVETEEELDYCLPNRVQTGTKLFTAGEVFETTASSFWS